MIREIVELDGANPYARRIEFYCGGKITNVPELIWMKKSVTQISETDI